MYFLELPITPVSSASFKRKDVNHFWWHLFVFEPISGTSPTSVPVLSGVPLLNSRGFLNYFAPAILHFNLLYSFKSNENIEKMNALQYPGYRKILILRMLPCTINLRYIENKDCWTNSGMRNYLELFFKQQRSWSKFGSRHQWLYFVKLSSLLLLFV